MKNLIFSVIALATSLPAAASEPAEPTAPAYYCAAACRDGKGKGELRYTTAARGDFETEAKQKAIDLIKDKCNFSPVSIGCSKESASPEVEYIAIGACRDSNYKMDYRYIQIGKGRSSMEARRQSLIATHNTYDCRINVDTFSYSVHDSTPYYCVAACTDSAGRADAKYAKGAKGTSETEAKFNALKEANKAYSCNYGVKLLGECESK